MRNRAGVFLLVLLLGTSLCPISARGAYPDSGRVRLFLDIQQFLYNDRFEEADSVCTVLTEAYPDDPAGHVFEAAVMVGRMTNREEDIYHDRFLPLLDSTETLIDSALRGADLERTSWLYLFRGHIEAYRSLYQSRFGSFIAAVKSGMRAMDNYEKGLAADSLNYDLYLGVGSYHYWKSAKAGFLRWLMIFKNEKKKGIDELRLAADSSTVFRDAARSALVWVWLNEKQYDSVLAIGREFALKYPGGKAVLWPMAQAYFEKRQYRSAIDAYEDIRREIAGDPGNYFNMIQCDYEISRCYERMNLTDSASVVADRVMEYYPRIPNKVLRQERPKLKFLRRLGRL